MFVCGVCGCYEAPYLNDWRRLPHFPSGHLSLLRAQLLDAHCDFAQC